MKESLPLPFEDENKIVSTVDGAFSNVFDSYISEKHIVKVSKRRFPLQVAQTELSRYISDYKEMEKFMGKYLPETSFMIVDDGTSLGGELYKIRIVQEKVFGENISLVLFEKDKSAKEQFEELLLMVIQHYRQTFSMETGFGKFLDISRENILVSQDGKDNSKLFFVDSSCTLLKFALKVAIIFIKNLIQTYDINSKQVTEALDKLCKMQKED